MNRLQGTCVGLSALLGAAVMPATAGPAPDTWHGGSVDVIVADPAPAAADQVEYDENMAGIQPGTGWVNIFGYELRGRNGPYEFTTAATTGAHWCTGGTERFADAKIDVPHNVRITFFRMWGADTSATHDVTAFLFQTCLALGAGNGTTTNIQEISSSGSPGEFSVTSEPNFGPTNLQNCTYFVRARFAENCAGVGGTTLRKVRIQYGPMP